MFRLQKKGNFEHYMISFQKECKKSFPKAVNLPLKEHYDVDTRVAVEEEAKTAGCDTNPDSLPGQQLFEFRIRTNWWPA